VKGRIECLCKNGTGKNRMAKRKEKTAGWGVHNDNLLIRFQLSGNTGDRVWNASHI
jgi:hypothetical protein